MSSEFIPGSPAAAPDPLIGQILGGNYQIERLLGSGGMGNVYLAKHTRLPKSFAVKIVRTEMAKDPAAFERFRREADIAAEIGNRHIVEVVDFNSLPDGSPYMVMEYLVGEDLGSRLARAGQLGLAECSHIMEQVASVLDAAHARGIVHRDIKPDNIFLCPVDGDTDFVKLLDFGLSKIRGSAKRLTANLSVMGTPWYMSPEQARGDADLDHRTDIYALGVVVYQVLCGRVPFEGENIYGVLTQIATQPPPPLSRFVPEIAPGLEAAVLRALSKAPADRPSSAGEFWDEAQRGIEATHASGYKIPPRTAPAKLADGSPFRVPTPSEVAELKTTPVARSMRSSGDATVPAMHELFPSMEVRDPQARTEPRKALADPEEPLVIQGQRSPLFLGGMSFAVTMLVAGILYLVFRHPIEGPAPVKSIAVETPLIPPKPALPTGVTVNFALTPPEAVVSLHGNPMPMPLAVQRGSAPLIVHVAAPGYVAQDRSVSIEADHTETVVLVAEPPLPPEPAASPPAASPPVEKPSAHANKKADDANHKKVSKTRPDSHAKPPDLINNIDD